MSLNSVNISLFVLVLAGVASVQNQQSDDFCQVDPSGLNILCQNFTSFAQLCQLFPSWLSQLCHCSLQSTSDVQKSQFVDSHLHIARKFCCAIKLCIHSPFHMSFYRLLYFSLLFLKYWRPFLQWISCTSPFP